MAGDRRFAIRTSLVMRCVDNEYEECWLKMSVRNQSIGLRIEGGDGWPHMTPLQARRLADWLAIAAAEAEERREREAAYLEAKHGR